MLGQRRRRWTKIKSATANIFVTNGNSQRYPREGSTIFEGGGGPIVFCFKLGVNQIMKYGLDTQSLLGYCPGHYPPIFCHVLSMLRQICFEKRKVRTPLDPLLSESATACAAGIVYIYRGLRVQSYFRSIEMSLNLIKYFLCRCL